MTRGMFVTALGWMAGINPDSYQSGKFTDSRLVADQVLLGNLPQGVAPLHLVLDRRSWEIQGQRQDGCHGKNSDFL